METYNSPERVDTERDLGNVLLLPEVNCLEHFIWRNTELGSSVGKPLDVLHQGKATSLCVDLLDAPGVQLVHHSVEKERPCSVTEDKITFYHRRQVTLYQ